HQIAQKNYSMGEYLNQNRAEQMTVDRDITRSEVERLNSEVAEATKAIQSMEVKAPRDGIVVYKPNNQNEKPAEGDEVSMIQKVLELPDLNTMIVETTIPEQNAYRISEGALVEMRLD